MRKQIHTLLALAALMGAGSTVAAPTVVKGNETTFHRTGNVPPTRNGMISPIKKGGSGLSFRKRRSKIDLAGMSQKRYRKHCRQNPTLYKSKKHRSNN